MLLKLKHILTPLIHFPKSYLHQQNGLHQLNQDFTADQLLAQKSKPRKRTKTVCTIGPQTDNIQTLIKLIDNGLSVARLNFNYNDHQQHRKTMLNIEKALKQRKSGFVSTLMDLKGPRIFTGDNAPSHPQISFKKATNFQHLGTNQRIACSYQDLPTSTAVGKKILIADGDIVSKVIKIQNGIVTVQIQNDGLLGPKRNMCLPGTAINLPTITKADQHDIINFGLKYKVNFIAVSFARYRRDIQYLRKILIQHDPVYGPYIQIISKLQSRQGIKNVDELIQVSDGIMVARGDLGMEVPLEKVVLLQKFVSNKALNAGKFIITSTQMLQSMETKRRPTRAQVSDITNSVFDLTDANMTSGQTSIGKYPIQTSSVLKQVAQQTQAFMDYKRIFQHRKYIISYRHRRRDVIGAIALAFELDCHFIFVKTDSVTLIGKISALRPKSYVIVFTNKIQVKGAATIRFGVYCYCQDEFKDSTDFLKRRGFKYGCNDKDPITILQIQAQGQKIVSSKVFRRN